jgi:hypothetical protein
VPHPLDLAGERGASRNLEASCTATPEASCRASYRASCRATCRASSSNPSCAAHPAPLQDQPAHTSCITGPLPQLLSPSPLLEPPPDTSCNSEPTPARTPPLTSPPPLLELHSAPDPRPDLHLWKLQDHPLLGTTRGGGLGDGRASVQVGTGVRSLPSHTLVYRWFYTHGRTPAAPGRNPKTVFGDSLLGPGTGVPAPPVSDRPATGHLWHFSPGGFRGGGTQPPAGRTRWPYTSGTFGPASFVRTELRAALGGP